MSVADQVPRSFQLDKKGSMELLREYKRTGDPDLRERIILGTIPIVLNVVRKMSLKRKVENFDDYISEGILGLISAVESFNPDAGFAFSTYATLAIKRWVSGYAFRHGSNVMIPANFNCFVAKLFGVTDDELDMMGESVTVGKMTFPTEHVKMALRASEAVTFKLHLHHDTEGHNESIDQSVMPEAWSDHEARTDDEDEYDAAMAFAKKSLSDRNLEILMLYHGVEGREKLSYRDIGTKYGLSHERTRQIVGLCHRDIREELSRQELTCVQDNLSVTGMRFSCRAKVQNEWRSRRSRPGSTPRNLSTLT